MTGSGGFAPRLTRTSDGVHGEKASFLASEDYTVKRAGVTFAADAVQPDEDGNKIIEAGTLCTPRASDGKYVPYDGLTDEVQTVTVSGNPTGGTFTLSLGGQTSAGIPFNASAEQVETALEGLSTVGDGNVSVTGNPGGPYRVSFQGDLADENVAQMTASGANLTGGSSPSVAVATSTAGGGSTGATVDNDTSGYPLESYNLASGDVVGGVMIRGSVLAARVHPEPDSTIRAALRGRIIFQ